VTQPDPLDLLRHALEAQVRIRPVAARGPDCLDEDTLAALAEGTLDGEPRIDALRHVAGCPHCRAAVTSLFQALKDPTVARELAALERGHSVRIVRIAAPLAAAAILFLLVWPGGTRDHETRPVHRAPTITAASVPTPTWPVGPVTRPRLLRWSAVLGADRYRVTLFDTRGKVLFEAQLPDTVATLPDSIVPAPGHSYLWKVEARTGWDRWSESELVPFSVADGAAP
jgi:hypothetical protein